jgi:integrase
MATISFHYRPSKRYANPEGSLFIRIIHNRKNRDIGTNYHIYPNEWDEEKQCIRLPDTYSLRMQYLIELDDKIQDDVQKLSTTVILLEEYGNYTIDDILRGFQIKPQENKITSYVEKVCNMLVENGQDRTARAYRTATNRLLEYNRYQDLCLDEINSTMIRKYELYLKELGKNMNTISFYMRNLRSIYNRAIKDHLILPRYENPFESVYTGIYPTRKRALTKEEMHQLSQLEVHMYDYERKRLPLQFRMKAQKDANINCQIMHQIDPDLQYALALFMFCFHARGMSFIDLAFLKKKNIKGDEINYCRKKTRKNMRIKITLPMKFILDYFDPMTKNSPYVFPIIVPGNGKERVQYENALHEQNKQLKKLGRLAGIEKTVTTHVARHSWATIARMEHIPLSVISEAMGHRDEKTTTIYLDSFNTSVIDRVSEQISRIIHT